jgi:curved DNA-binding protein CbpA
MGDHYLTLGIGRGASQREIVRAYRGLARRYHPDVSAAPALELFLAVQEAYETLSDRRRRASYDSELRRLQQRVPAASPRVRAQPVPSPSPVVAGNVRREQIAPDVGPSTVALWLVASSGVALLAGVVLGNVVAGGTRFVWVGVCALLGVLAVVVARSLATRQLEQLWRWSACAGRGSLRRSGVARAASHRIQLADGVTLLGRRAVLIAIPIVFLLVPR